MLDDLHQQPTWPATAPEAPAVDSDEPSRRPAKARESGRPRAESIAQAAPAVTARQPIAAKRPTRRQAEAAVRTLIRWAGDDPKREGLLDTPERVVRAYDDFFAGYRSDPASLLALTFEEIESYDEMIILKDVPFESYCEHHMVPIIGRAHIAYLPRHRVVGISKLARLVDAFAKRLQIQEKLTAQIADTLQNVLQPRGVAVVMEAIHQCMTTRGVHKPGVAMVTSRLLGTFRDDPSTRREFLALVGRNAL